MYFFYKTSYLNKEVNCTEPSTLVSVPWLSRGILKGDLLFDWFGIGCVTTDNFCFYL
jgi:hypothetical protein